MEMVILALFAGMLLGAMLVYFLLRGKSKKKHWSEGYTILGEKDFSKKEEPVKQPEQQSIFPPGW
jgi:hypothetical protein